MGSKVFYGCDNLTALAMLNPECEIYEDKNTLGSPTQTTIYGYIDSTAQDYAEKYGYTFKTLDQCPWDPGMEARDNLLRIVKTGEIYLRTIYQTFNSILLKFEQMGDAKTDRSDLIIFINGFENRSSYLTHDKSVLTIL